MRKQLAITYEDIISIENLLVAWEEFVHDKRGKEDAQAFQLHLMDNIITLHQELKTYTYVHSRYHAFKINDPKLRDIHKAIVRDRLVHHAIYRQLYPFFDQTFIADSFSCRLRKGTHRTLDRFREFARKVNKNNTRTCWVLKCDIRKFFASVDHQTLYDILAQYIPDESIGWLLTRVVESFSSTVPDKGLPLGNLTSQLLVNIYMNEFDQFVKHTLKAKHYIRYADDFVFLSGDRALLERFVPRITVFLEEKLKLQMHPNKVSISTLASGVDFLGWVHFPGHRVLRTTTKRRMFKKIARKPEKPVVASYLGLLSHGNARKLSTCVEHLSSDGDNGVDPVRESYGCGKLSTETFQYRVDY